VQVQEGPIVLGVQESVNLLRTPVVVTMLFCTHVGRSDLQGRITHAQFKTVVPEKDGRPLTMLLVHVIRKHICYLAYTLVGMPPGKMQPTGEFLARVLSVETLGPEDDFWVRQAIEVLRVEVGDVTKQPKQGYLIREMFSKIHPGFFLGFALKNASAASHTPFQVSPTTHWCQVICPLPSVPHVLDPKQ
jgi:hypothetical protein